jgi:hypothetical protein
MLIEYIGKNVVIDFFNGSVVTALLLGFDERVIRCRVGREIHKVSTSSIQGVSLLT